MTFDHSQDLGIASNIIRLNFAFGYHCNLKYVAAVFKKPDRIQACVIFYKTVKKGFVVEVLRTIPEWNIRTLLPLWGKDELASWKRDMFN